MNYKVLITASGLGSRLGNLTKFTNKGLVRIGKKPALSYIIESYPDDVEFVITLGHYGDHVKQFLSLAYPDKKITYVPVENYDGEGSSLLYSMSLCKDELQCPFIFHACDTVVEKEEIDLGSNWVAGHKNGSSFQYRTLNVSNNKVLKINEKGEGFFDYVYIGLCGIKDYELFWKYTDEILEETTVSSLSDCHVISKMMDHSDFSVVDYKTWYDIGNVDSLKKSREAIPDRFHLLDKEDESIFIFDEDFVIKFFYDKQVSSNRVKRMGYIKEVTPKLLGSTDNFYKYRYALGDTFSNVVTPKTFRVFLAWAKDYLWKKPTNVNISDKCKDFYYNKTYNRVVKYYADNGIVKDEKSMINDHEIPPLFGMLEKVKETSYMNSEVKGYRFHGDLVLENIICDTKFLRMKFWERLINSKFLDFGLSNFTLIDWRQDFSGDMRMGDIYYDLAKLRHNLIVSHDVLDKGLYTLDIEDTRNVRVDIMRSHDKYVCTKEIEMFVNHNELDIRKVNLLTSLIWLNMAPLHPKPISDFLFYFGKYNLYRAITYDE